LLVLLLAAAGTQTPAADLQGTWQMLQLASMCLPALRLLLLLILLGRVTVIAVAMAPVLLLLLLCLLMLLLLPRKQVMMRPAVVVADFQLLLLLLMVVVVVLLLLVLLLLLLLMLMLHLLPLWLMMLAHAATLQLESCWLLPLPLHLPAPIAPVPPWPALSAEAPPRLQNEQRCEEGMQEALRSPLVLPPALRCPPHPQPDDSRIPMLRPSSPGPLLLLPRRLQHCCKPQHRAQRPSGRLLGPAPLTRQWARQHPHRPRGCRHSQLPPSHALQL
jgi:hypothetical protein